MVRRLGRYNHRKYNLLRFLRCAACRLLEVLPGLTDYKISKSERTPLPLNLSTDVIRHRWFGHVCRMQRDNIIRQAYKQDFKGQQKRGRPLKRWSDQIRNDTGLPLLTAERHAINRTEQRGAFMSSQVSQSNHNLSTTKEFTT